MEDKILSHLLSFVSEHKRALFAEIIALRTLKITVVLEDIYQSHNAAAVLRSCDCFGIQNVHIIENRNEWKPHPDIEQGSSKWLSLFRYSGEENNTAPCLQRLKKKGYAIASTTPHARMSIDELPVDKPVALVMGNEKEGISDKVKEHSDYLVKIPMYGFTESFNISVATAISLHAVRVKFEREKVPLSMSEDEKTKVLLEWCKTTVKHSDRIAEEFLRRSQEI